MDSFTLNKAAGAVLMVLILTMGVGIVSDVIFHPTIPGKPGYEIVVESAEDATSTVQAEPDVVPISERLLAASASDGANVAKKCAACHSFDAHADLAGLGVFEPAADPSRSLDHARVEQALAAEAQGVGLDPPVIRNRPPGVQGAAARDCPGPFDGDLVGNRQRSARRDRHLAALDGQFGCRTVRSDGDPVGHHHGGNQ